MARGRVWVVAVNWNGAEVLPGLLGSIAPQIEECGAGFLLFDNGSTDGSDRNAEEALGSRPWFRIVRSPLNLGFAAGANAALMPLDAEFAVLVNTDTVFCPGSIRALLDGIGRHQGAAVAGPRLLWPDGTLQRSMRDFPFTWRLVREHLPYLRRASARWADHATERSADWLVGAVLCLRMSAFREAGGFDEDYFFYHEETDLQYRLHRAGWETWFVPASEVVHIEGFSARRLYGPDTTLRYIPAKLRFLRKHGKPGAVTIFRLFMSSLHLGRLLAGLFMPGRRSDCRYTAGYCRQALSALWAPASKR
jgi:N-acetylglucosaminyl-diphospho-decaprenol L-rhamnosyltransferase